MALAGAAAPGSATALLECDLAQPRLALDLGLAPTPGLHEYLRWEATPSEVVQPLTLAGSAASRQSAPLACVSAGRQAADSGALLGLQSFRHMTAKLRNAYDLVVFLGPPLGRRRRSARRRRRAGRRGSGRDLPGPGLRPRSARGPGRDRPPAGRRARGRGHRRRLTGQPLLRGRSGRGRRRAARGPRRSARRRSPAPRPTACRRGAISPPRSRGRPRRSRRRRSAPVGGEAEAGALRQRQHLVAVLGDQRVLDLVLGLARLDQLFDEGLLALRLRRFGELEQGAADRAHHFGGDFGQRGLRRARPGPPAASRRGSPAPAARRSPPAPSRVARQQRRDRFAQVLAGRPARAAATAACPAGRAGSSPGPRWCRIRGRCCRCRRAAAGS